MLSFDLILNAVLILGTICWVVAHRKGLLFDFWINHCRFPRQKTELPPPSGPDRRL